MAVMVQYEFYKGKGVCKLFMEIHLTTRECHLPYVITQCYLPPNTSEHTPPLPQPDRLVLEVAHFLWLTM